MSDDFTHDTSTTGSVAVGGTVTGEIEARNDIDWFAVELMAGRHYVIDLEGADSGGGTLDSTVLRGLYDADGNHIVGSHSNFGGDSEDARLTFTAAESGKYFIAARGSAGATTGTYTVRVTESTFSDGERAGAKDLGDITDLRGARFPNTTLDGDGDTADYFRFTLGEAKAVELGLRQQDANADLFLEDAQGTVLASSTEAGTANELIVQTLLAGTYYIRVEAQEAGANQFKLRYGVSDADAAAVAALEAQRQTEQQGEQQAPVNQAPTFNAPSYAFDLAELADGSVTAVALGTVSASDPESATLTYSIEEGNDAGLFAIDESTGALTYTGTGEDYETGTKSYPLTVRASDGTHTTDVAVTVSVTDVEEAPEFGQPSYAFDLAELADGSVTPVALGAVSATDPQNDTVTYSIEEGNDDALFEIDRATGALTYTGTGEDYESGTTSYPLTVRASDGTHTTDVAVTVSVTDVEEAPEFGQPSYAFDLAELADGSGTPVALGAVSATDPQNDTVTYSIEDGNDDALFEIDESTGALTYKGTGEDYESGTTSYPLTVRASDGTNTTDVTVTVNVTDVDEAPRFGQPSYEFDLAEVADGSGTAVALGTVSATDPQNDTVTYSIEDGNDDALFEIDRATGALTYKGTGEDYETVPTSYELTVRASDGAHTTNVAVTVRVTDVDEEQPEQQVDVNPARAAAVDLGDITNLEGVQFPTASLDGEGEQLYYRFTLTEAKSVGLGLRRLDADADLFLEDAQGKVLNSGTKDGTASEWMTTTLLAGTYYVRVEAQEDGANDFILRYGVGNANPSKVAALEAQRAQEANQAPAFDAPSYAFDLAELADGSVTAVALGAVSATDPQDDTVTYSIEDGNDAGLFEIDESTGALTYTGSGEDYESGTTSYPLTVRASDGTNTTDVAVTVRVTDVEEAPTFGEPSYAFDLAELADGSVTAVALGTVSATDLQNDTLTYSIAAGNDDGLFEIDESTGALSYKGTGEDYETAPTSYELTVRASDGTHTTDVTVTVRVTDVEEAPTFGEPSYAFDLAELADGSVTAVALGTVSATDPQNDTVNYSIAAGNDDELFAIDPATGALTYKGTGEDYESDTTGYELTVRASDGTNTTDVAVTVRVTDVQDTSVSEPDGKDLPANSTTAGRVAVGGTATGNIGTWSDRDWFAVELVAGRTYQIDLRGSPTDDGTLSDPYLWGLYDPDGTYISGTKNDDVDGSRNRNSHVEFTALETGTHYIAADAFSKRTGTYELEVTDTSAQTFGQASYAFDLAENVAGNVTAVALGTVSATDPEGDTLTYSIAAGNDDELFAIDPATGALSYNGPGEDYESDTKSYALTVRVSDGANSTEVAVAVRVTDVLDTLAFEQPSYAFDLAENTDGSDTAVALGAVSASDPEGDTLTYSITAGNDDELFAIDPATGALSYAGAGEDYESETKSHVLTVQASDGTNTTDVTVTVNVTDVDLLGTPSYRFTLDENLDGSTNSVHLGSLTPRPWKTVTEDLSYSITSGNDADLFELDTSTGALSYTGTGEDHESDTTSHELTVRVTDMGLYDDVTVTVNIRDLPEPGETVSEPEGEDFAGNERTQGRVAVGGTATGEIGLVNDYLGDWFAVILESGKLYRFDLDVVQGGAALQFIQRPNESSDSVFLPNLSDDPDGRDSLSWYRAREDGIHYLSVDTDSSHTPWWLGGDPGKYRLSVTETEDDYAEDVGTTGRVVPGGFVTGAIEEFRDSDWFAVDLVQGKSYEIDLEGRDTSKGTLHYTQIGGVRDSNGTLVPDTSDIRGGEGDNSRIVFLAPASGTYYIDVRGWDYFRHSNTGTYTLSVGQGAGDDPADTSTDRSVVVGGSALGAIEEANDRDWFAVSLEAGNTYQIDLEGSFNGKGTLHDPYVHGIHDKDGILVVDTTDDEGGYGRDSRVFFTASEDAIHYVAAGGDGSVTGTYKLSVANVTGRVAVGDDTVVEPAGGDLPADTSTTGRVTVEGSATGDISASGDVDWFAVDLIAGTDYLVAVEGFRENAGTLDGTKLVGIYDADGNALPHSVGYGSTFYLIPETGTYYVGVAGILSGGVTRTGTYTVSVSEAEDPDDYGIHASTAGSVTVGGEATGEIGYADDRDWFAVELEAGKAYAIDFMGGPAGKGTVVNPGVLRVFDPDENLIVATSRNRGPLNSEQATFVASESGTHYFEVNMLIALNLGERRTGTYTVSVSELTDDFSDDVTTTGALSPGGSASGSHQYDGDVDWFAVDLIADTEYFGRADRTGGYESAPGKGWTEARFGASVGGLYDSSGDLVSSGNTFSVEQSGRYYVSVVGSLEGEDYMGTGAYSVFIGEVVETL